MKQITSYDSEFSSKINEAVHDYDGIQKAVAFTGSFEHVSPGISGRLGFERKIYDYFRPAESVPCTYNDIIMSCDNMYWSVCIVRHVIDLMSDFACQGVRISHPNKRSERFLRSWFEKIDGQDRSERFLNYLYRHNMIVAKASVGKITTKTKNEMSRAGFDEEKRYKREIPLKYTFLHPVTIQYSKNVSLFGDNNKNLSITSPIHTQYMGVGRNNLIIGGFQKPIPLDDRETFVYFYKKDDWQLKPIPFLYPLLKHAKMLEKLELADKAALDGAISNIRIFRLGNLEYKIPPNATAVSKLDEILRSNVGGGTLDIIWGPDIDLIESKTTIHQFLGEEKYAPHLSQMYIGLGIPPTMAGTGGGTTNNYISLKTLIKRLKSGRERLITFWQEQLDWVCKSMDIKGRAVIEFDYLDLGDEDAQNNLLIHLAERDLISEERLHNLLDNNHELERVRTVRENKERKSGKRPEKAGPYHDPQFEIAYNKISLQRGYISPDQLGFVPEEGTENSEVPFDKQIDMQKQKQVSNNKPAGKSGRPDGAKDSEKRTRRFTPQIKAAMDLWVTQAQDKINEILKPHILKVCGKKNMRSLTAEETEIIENIKTSVLYSIPVFSDITENIVLAGLSNKIPTNLQKTYNNYIDFVKGEIKRDLTFDEIRRIQGLVYMENLSGDN